MSENIIEIKNVSMRFNLYKEKVDNLKEFIIRLSKGNLQHEEFWALKDISFEVKKGQSLALIGRNGSGKSTLLKLIAGVMKPTHGEVKVYGNIAPLIELGAGFDPDLTARENIFLNGAVLGHSKTDMQENFDSILEFSELEDFIDVPVKNFSSGMYARLGFSIATVNNPDILIVDEILSVGDFKFQEKCMDRINSMIKQGTNLLFVSHSANQIMELCEKAIWIENGILKEYGDSKSVYELYSNS